MSFLQLTAESSSALNGEESRCLEAATPDPITQPYIAIALRPIQHPLRCLHPRRVQKTPNHVFTIIMPLISDDFNQDGLKTPTRSSSADDPCLSIVPSIQQPIHAMPGASCQWKGTLDACLYDTSRCSTFTVQQCHATEYLSCVIENEAGCSNY